MAWFLLSRGLWLVFLELTVIRYSWLLHLDYSFSFGGVLWAIGWSMVALAGLVFLPLSAITVFGVAMIAMHNLFDGVRAESWGDYHWVWCILHTGEMFEVLPGVKFHPFYPLIPWIGVMAVGYSFGSLQSLDTQRRRRAVLGLGISLTLLFVVVRFVNVYGDKANSQPGHPGPWSPQEDWSFTLLSFLNCQKYPPSLDFLLMTLGPALILLALLDRGDRETGRVGRFFLVFGRVPLFFYILHWFVIKGIVLGLSYWEYGQFDWMFGEVPRPANYGYHLWVVYVVWVGVVLLFYPFCSWFADIKRRSQAVWLRYL